jgi:hypothetical protein
VSEDYPGPHPDEPWEQRLRHGQLVLRHLQALAPISAPEVRRNLGR